MKKYKTLEEAVRAALKKPSDKPMYPKKKPAIKKAEEKKND